MEFRIEHDAVTIHFCGCDCGTLRRFSGIWTLWLLDDQLYYKSADLRTIADKLDELNGETNNDRT